METTSEYEGLVLQDTYRIEHLLGEGGMGAVYQAAHLRVNRRFAVKMLSPSVARNPDALARFKREALVTSSLDHPHILEVMDFNTTPEGVPYIIMELLSGEDLAKRLERVRRLELDQAVSICVQATSALAAAHEHGIIHRDLKPSNIFLCKHADSENYAKVVDFGISKVLGSNSGLTRTRSVMGTPCYMSPEQAESRSAEVDARSDVYAMGTILYEMLGGLPPFIADTIPSLLYKVVHEEPVPLSNHRPDLPGAMVAVVEKALCKEPGDRFNSMEALKQALLDAFDLTRIPVVAAQEQEEEDGELTAEVPAAPISTHVKEFAGATTEDHGAAGDPGMADTAPEEPALEPAHDAPDAAETDPLGDLKTLPAPSEPPPVATAPPVVEEPATDVMEIPSALLETDTATAMADAESARESARTERPSRRAALLTGAVLLLGGGALVWSLGSGSDKTEPLPAVAAAAGAASTEPGAPAPAQPRVASLDPVATPDTWLPPPPAPEQKPAPKKAAAAAPKPKQKVRPRPPRRKPTRSRSAGVASLRVAAIRQGKSLVVDVLIDGKRAGQTPLFMKGIKAGSHTIRAGRHGLKWQQKTRNLRARRDNSVVFLFD